MAREFVHVEHANHFAELYRCKREEYSALCEVVRHLLQSILPRDKYSIHSIDARAKDIESFRKKAGQPHPVSKEKPKYDLPLDQIRDLAGVRVITGGPVTGVTTKLTVTDCGLFDTPAEVNVTVPW